MAKKYCSIIKSMYIYFFIKRHQLLKCSRNFSAMAEICKWVWSVLVVIQPTDQQSAVAPSDFKHDRAVAAEPPE